METRLIKAALGATTILGIATFLAQPAFAQAADGASAQTAARHARDGEVDSADIIVTARRTEERLQDVPISITVFNQQQLSNRNVVNAQDLAAYTPSLSANSNFGSDNSSFAIRGFVQDNGTAPAVGVYFADVVAPRGASNGLPAGDGAGPGAFFDLQNVQVLKGPQGTLFGRNTTGGAVLLVPQKPTSKLEGYMEGSYGNYDMKRIQAVVNVPLSDIARFRIGIDRQKRDGYVHNTSGVGPKDFNDVNYTAVRASLVVDLTPELENYTIVSYSRSNTHGPAQKLIAADATNNLGSFGAEQLADQAANGEGFYDARQDLTNASSKLEQWQVINTTTWKASDTLTVKNIISYAQLKDTLNSPLFGTAFSTPAIPGFLPSFRFGFASSQPIPGGYTANQSTFTEELQLQGRTADDRLTWQAGGYLEVSNPLSTVGSQSPVVISCTDVATLQCVDILGFLGNLNPATPAEAKPVHAGAVNVTKGRTYYRDVGVYAQATYKITDQFKLTGGIRYTWDREINDSFRQTYLFGYPGDPVGPIGSFCTDPLATGNGCNDHYALKTSAPTWLIDLDYTPNDNILVYAKYARGYRAGVIAPNVTDPYNYVKAEKVDAYEAGVKTSFAGAVRGVFNVAGFYNNFSNQQLQLGFNAAPGAPISPTAAPINAGKSRIYGAEVQASISPFRGLTVDAGYTYLHTEILSIPTFSAPPGSLLVPSGQQFKGDPLELSPKNKYTVTGTYTLPIDENIGTISVGATFTHTDSQVTNYADRFYPVAAIQPLSRIQATNILNLNVNWNSIAGTPIDLALFATNVTKDKYYTYIPGLIEGTGFETAQLGEPRMYGARLRVRFGD